MILFYSMHYDYLIVGSGLFGEIFAYKSMNFALNRKNYNVKLALNRGIH